MDYLLHYTPCFKGTLKRSPSRQYTQEYERTCGKYQVKRCLTCKIYVDFINNTRGIQQGENNNCSTCSMVYLITCNACPACYVGKTGNKLQTRPCNLRSDIRHYNDTQVARHFNGVDHSYANLRITIFNPAHFLTTPHWKPSTDGTVNPGAFQDLKVSSQEG